MPAHCPYLAPPPPSADVVGLEDGLGVECLSGSGAIASAYARAFREGFTLTLVSGRTVGIGAYLARLGRRRADARQQAHLLCWLPALEHARAWRQMRWVSGRDAGGPTPCDA